MRVSACSLMTLINVFFLVTDKITTRSHRLIQLASNDIGAVTL